MKIERRGFIKRLAAVPIIGRVLSNVTTVEAAIQNWANRFMSETGARGLNVDHWAYYWTKVTGEAFTGSGMTKIIERLGVADRSKEITFSVFRSAMK